MKTFDEIIDECAKAKMVKWDINSFKETHPSLYKVIINAMQQVKNCNTPDVSESFCECQFKIIIRDQKTQTPFCLSCMKEIQE